MTKVGISYRKLFDIVNPLCYNSTIQAANACKFNKEWVQI